MYTAAIIAEYNPFHNGHAYHIEKTREHATHIVAIMSGALVQRGEPAIMDKRIRARMAVEGGADLVLELPAPFSCSSAERFSFAGVYIAHALGIVDTLSFGSEGTPLCELTRTAQALLSEEYTGRLQRALSGGRSFAAIREHVLTEMGVSPPVTPNDILAVEYIKQLILLKSPIKPLPIRRLGAYHDEASVRGDIASASYIRKQLLSDSAMEGLVPAKAYDIIVRELELGHAPASIKFIERTILYKLRTMSREEIKALPDVSEGLENRIFRAAHECTSLEELYLAVKSKRYAHARIRRIVLYALLGVTKADIELIPPYVRILAFNERGTEILRQAKRKASIPLLHSLPYRSQDETVQQFIRLDRTANDIFLLCTPNISI